MAREQDHRDVGTGSEGSHPGTVSATAPSPAGATDDELVLPIGEGEDTMTASSTDVAAPSPVGDPAGASAVAGADVTSEQRPEPDAPRAGAAGVGADGGDALEELTLPSLVLAPDVLPDGTVIGPEGRLRVGEHLGTRGRINRYRASWRQDDGDEIDVE